MNINDRGVGWTVGLVVLGLLVATGVFAIGITAGADEPTGEDILNETATQYADADSILTQGTITIETENNTATGDIEAIATADNKTLFSVTDDNRTITTAATEEFVWATADDAQVYIYADADGAGVYTLSGLEIVEIDQDSLPDEAEFPDELPDPEDLNKSEIESELDDRLAEFENVSAAEFNESIDDALLEQFPSFENVSADEFNASAVDESVIGEIPELESVSELPAGLNENVTAAAEALSTINSTDDLRSAVTENVTAERVETTTLDGTEVHVVSVTHTDTEDELRYWIATDTNEIIKQELTTPTVTVTVEAETEFNPDVQDSTFEPPAPTPDELPSYDALQERTFFEAAGAETLTASVENTTETYTFDSGTVVSVPIGDGQLASSLYDGDRTIALAETDTPIPLSGGELDEETGVERTIAGTNVTIVEGSAVDTAVPGADGLDAETVSVATWTTDETTVILAVEGETEPAAAAAAAVLED